MQLNASLCRKNDVSHFCCIIRKKSLAIVIATISVPILETLNPIRSLLILQLRLGADCCLPCISRMRNISTYDCQRNFHRTLSDASISCVPGFETARTMRGNGECSRGVITLYHRCQYGLNAPSPAGYPDLGNPQSTKVTNI
jgi:hypothetical protein